MNDKALTTDWLDQVIGTDSNRAAAEKAGIEQSSLLNRRKRCGVTAEDVIAIARAYNRPVWLARGYDADAPNLAKSWYDNHADMDIAM